MNPRPRASAPRARSVMLDGSGTEISVIATVSVFPKFDVNIPGARNEPGVKPAMIPSTLLGPVLRLIAVQPRPMIMTPPEEKNGQKPPAAEFQENSLRESPAGTVTEEKPEVTDPELARVGSVNENIVVAS